MYFKGLTFLGHVASFVLYEQIQHVYTFKISYNAYVVQYDNLFII